MKRKTKNMILAIAVSVVAIFIPSWIFNKWFEGFVFFVCHWLIREQYPKQYHHIIPSMCRLITSVTFFFGVSFILPFSLSLFSAVPINYFIGWIGFTKKQADTFEFKYEKLKAQLERKSHFNTENCTLEQLLARCKEIDLSEENTQIAIELFVNKTKQSIIADNLCIEEKSVQQKKRRLKEKLNK
jgi:hypothetical protein